MASVVPTKAPHLHAARLVLAAFVVAALLVDATATPAATTAEQTCLKDRYLAAAKYAACHQKALAKLFGGAPFDTKLQAALSKCHVKYTATWPKLAVKASGSGATCDAPRFGVSGGTVLDRLTGLQWENKQNLDGMENPADPHDADNTYSLSMGFELEDGTAFASFLPTLNSSGACFAGQCDWRLPTIAELQTILLQAYPCTTTPCLDPVFYPMAARGDYWSATTFADDVTTAWYVYFPDGSVDGFDSGYSSPVRAVRAGL